MCEWVIFGGLRTHLRGIIGELNEHPEQFMYIGEALNTNVIHTWIGWRKGRVTGCSSARASLQYWATLCTSHYAHRTMHIALCTLHYAHWTMHILQRFIGVKCKGAKLTAIKIRGRTSGQADKQTKWHRHFLSCLSQLKKLDKIVC